MLARAIPGRFSFREALGRFLFKREPLDRDREVAAGVVKRFLSQPHTQIRFVFRLHMPSLRDMSAYGYSKLKVVYLLDMDPDLKSFLETFTARFEARFDAVAKRLDNLDARLETTEKKLLAEFYKWSPIEVRLRAAEVQTLALLERITLLEARIDKIDGGFISSTAKMQ